MRDADQESLRHRDERLTLSQQQIEQALRLDAAQLIETATVIGSDATLASTIEDAERGLGEPRLLQKSLQKRLRRLSDGKSWRFCGYSGGKVRCLRGWVSTKIAVVTRSMAGHLQSLRCAATGSMTCTEQNGRILPSLVCR